VSYRRVPWASFKKLQKARTTTFVEVRGLCKSYVDVKAVKEISFSVLRGEICGIPAARLGPSDREGRVWGPTGVTNAVHRGRQGGGRGDGSPSKPCQLDRAWRLVRGPSCRSHPVLRAGVVWPSPPFLRALSPSVTGNRLRLAVRSGAWRQPR
jgi:hypothetical protein